MRKFHNLLIVSSLLISALLTSCITSEVWKKWEDEGTFSENRLRPSEVKNLLTTTEVWKMTYEGADFYFTFKEDGTVTTYTDEKILRDKIATEYHLDYEGEKIVLLKVIGSGSLQYLKKNQEDTYVITAYSKDQIVATGKNNSQPMVLTPTTSEALNSALSQKSAMMEQIKKIDASAHGAISVAGSDYPAAVYNLSSDIDNNWSMKLITVDNGAVITQEFPLALDITGSKAQFTTPGITIGTETMKSLTLDLNAPSTRVFDNEKITFSPNIGQAFINFHKSSAYKTHKIDRDVIHPAFADLEEAQIEFDDRTPRNIVLCPSREFDERWWYIFVNITASTHSNYGSVVLKEESSSLPFGGYGNDIANSKKYLKPFYDFFFAPEGFCVLKDDTSYFLVNPLSGAWMRLYR